MTQISQIRWKKKSTNTLTNLSKVQVWYIWKEEQKFNKLTLLEKEEMEKRLRCKTYMWIKVAITEGWNLISYNEGCKTVSADNDSVSSVSRKMCSSVECDRLIASKKWKLSELITQPWEGRLHFMRNVIKIVLSAKPFWNSYLWIQAFYENSYNKNYPWISKMATE